MNILFVCSGNNTFGISPIIKSQGDSLVRKGINVQYFSLKGKGLTGYIQNIKPLRLLLKKKEYDVIHAHYSLTGWVVVLANLGLLPIVVSFMGCDTYGDYDKNGRKIFSGYLNVLAAKFLQPFVKKIIVKSKNLEKYVYKKEKSEIIPNGVNMDIFRPLSRELCRKDLNLDNDKKYILFLANPSDPRKNFYLLKNAVSLIELDNVEILMPYPIQHYQIPYYLNAADLLVLTSFNEGSPNVVKEAMACNCPVVSTKVGDIEELLGKTEGCYITSFDPADLASKIKKAIAFGKPTSGRKDIAHLDDCKIAEKLICLYENVIKKKS